MKVQRIERFATTFAPLALASITALCAGLATFVPAFYAVVVIVEGIKGLLAKIVITDVGH